VEVKSARTFDSSVKHLFRYLGDFRRLKTNPIARPFFEAARAAGSARPARQALSDLRAEVLELAQGFHDEGVEAGNGVRAARQLTIVKLHYFDGVSMQDVAKSLNLSVKHCYRERAAICGRIARALVRREATDVVVTATEDGFYVLLDRLLEHAETSRADLEACEYLQNLAKNTFQRLAALQAFAVLSMRSGDDAAAEAGYLRAMRLYDEQRTRMRPEFRRTAEASVSQLASMIAFYRGQTDYAFAAAKRSVECLDRGPIERAAYTDRFYVHAHLNFASMLWARGDLARAYVVLCEAAAGCDRLAPSAPVRIKVEGSIWKLRSYLVLSNPFPLAARIGGLLDAKDRALRAGAIFEAIDAMLAVTECYAFGKRDERALESARATLSLATSAHPVLQKEAAIELGVRLLSTKFWREALQLFPHGGARDALSNYHRSMLSYGTALASYRAGDVEHAWGLTATGAANGTWASLDVRQGLLVAESAYLLGRKAQACEAAEAALAAAERLGAAPLLRGAYAVAGRLLGRPRVRARAQEIEGILAA
jgi:hypothetical protein